jgi:hypothetical protein
MEFKVLSELGSKSRHINKIFLLALFTFVLSILLYDKRLCNSEVCDLVVLSARGPQARAMIKRHVPHFIIA